MTLDLSGLAVALATPFTLTGEVDLPAFRQLVRHVVAGGVDTLVPLGTTGEASTLLDVERDALITACLEERSGRRVIVGTAGALVVTPYYNKPNPDGLVAHYEAVAEAAPGFPLIAYNVPGRTGLNVTPAVLMRLWQNPQVVAVKESSGSLAQIAEVARTLPQGKTLLSGDDNLALAALAVGATGLVSVLGNVLPGETAAMIAASGWDGETPLYDPCCGSGTIAIEAAQIACPSCPPRRPPARSWPRRSASPLTAPCQE